MGATVGPVDTARFASDLENLWVKFNKLDPEAMLASGGGLGALPGGNANVADEKAEQEATGFLLDLVSVSEANGLKLPRGEPPFFFWNGVTTLETATTGRSNAVEH